MQTELFEMVTPASTSEVEAVSRKNILEKTILTLRFDQAVGVVLVLMVFYVLSFSWGFEKGKHSVHNAQVIKKAVAVPAAPDLPENLTIIEDAPAVSVKAETVSSVAVSADDTAPVASVSKAEAISKGKPAGKYTIQHIIYKTKSAAEREIRNLTKKGQSAFIIPSGKYLQVCVSGFQTKKEADKYMKQLRSQRIIAGDAYVRPIPA